MKTDYAKTSKDKIKRGFMFFCILFFTSQLQANWGTPDTLWSYDSWAITLSSPAIADVNGDNLCEIMFTDNIGKIHSLNSNGTLRWSYSLGTPYYMNFCSPAVAIIDDNDTASVIVANEGAKLYCLNAVTGSLKWSFSTGFSLSRYGGSPTIANVDTTGDPEILFGSSHGKLFCLNSTGGIKWSYFVGDTLANIITPVVERIDTTLEPAVLTTSKGRLFCLNGTNGSLRWMSDSVGVGGEISIADLNRDCEPEIVSSGGDSIFCFEKDGTLKWGARVPPVGYGVRSAIAIADLDFLPDSLPEMLIFSYAKGLTDTSTQRLYCIRENAARTGIDMVWQEGAYDNVWGGSGAGAFIWEIEDNLRIAAWCGNSLEVFNGADGKHPDGSGNPFYRNTQFSSRTAYEFPGVADINNDGRSELVAIYGVYGFGALTSTEWKDLRNVMNEYTYHITNINDDLTIPRKELPSWLWHNTWLAQVPLKYTSCPSGLEEAANDLINNKLLVKTYAKPYSKIVTIEFNLPVEMSIKLDIYDIAGKKINTLVNAVETSGSKKIQWDTKLQSSGIYLYRLKTDNFTKTGKIVLVK
ncbi:MAG: PQQ-binding-like beta-propeller repeat protein [bacterium]|nr:PQQ-binding-like beta-propeller repeat protein [bacterium]